MPGPGSTEGVLLGGLVPLGGRGALRIQITPIVFQVTAIGSGLRYGRMHSVTLPTRIVTI